MKERSTNRFAYATLIDYGIDPEVPKILLEVGMQAPVDWEAEDDRGIICSRLDFDLLLGGIAIRCVLDRVHREFGLHGDAYVYVLVLRPELDDMGRDVHATALRTAMREAHARARSWVEDVETVRVSWRHAPESYTTVENGAYEPEPPAIETPRATEDEIARMCDAFDAFCDDVDPHAVIPLDEGDIEVVIFERHRPTPPAPRFASMVN